ncbi:hypothetical protein, partial [Levilactobacillus koreensis]|uniref:hypothetical protein n=1 Tax=Levilactobacillus koreensis TaxID=637971 RepID=UPI001F182BD5
RTTSKLLVSLSNNFTALQERQPTPLSRLATPLASSGSDCALPQQSLKNLPVIKFYDPTDNSF